MTVDHIIIRTMQLKLLEEGNHVYYVVIGRSKDGTEGYGIKVESIKILPGGQIYYIDAAGIGSYTDMDSLVLNPEVIRECTPALHKIRLEG